MTRDFALWCGTASVAERCEAAVLLCDALLDPGASAGERQHCQDALLHLASDASPKVRIALASRLASEPRAPRRIVRLLCDDTDAVAVPLARSHRALMDEDLIDLAATGSTRLRCAIARRSGVSISVSAALLCSGERIVALELLANANAQIAPTTLRGIADGPDGGDADIRERLLQRHALPADIRQMLVMRIGETLADMGLARQVLGEAAARRIANEACAQATPMIAEDLSAPRMSEFVDHLRITGQVTTAFLVRVACCGQIDLFAASLSNLSGLNPKRVRAILVEARDPAFSALCAAARIPERTVPLLLCAVRIWKDLTQGRIVAQGDAAIFVLERLTALVRSERLRACDETRGLLVRLSAQAVRRAAPQSDLARLVA